MCGSATVASSVYTMYFLWHSVHELMMQSWPDPPPTCESLPTKAHHFPSNMRRLKGTSHFYNASVLLPWQAGDIIDEADWGDIGSAAASTEDGSSGINDISGQCKRDLFLWRPNSQKKWIIRIWHWFSGEGLLYHTILKVRTIRWKARSEMICR